MHFKDQTESLKPCIVFVEKFQWFVEKLFAPNSPIYRITLVESQEEEHRQLQSVMRFTQAQ